MCAIMSLSTASATSQINRSCWGCLSGRSGAGSLVASVRGGQIRGFSVHPMTFGVLVPDCQGSGVPVTHNKFRGFRR